MAKHTVSSYVGVLLVLLSSACIPAFPKGAARAPSTAVPPSYGGLTDRENSAQQRWQDFFADPKLCALIDEALKNNQELNILTQELDIAENEISARRGELYPKVGLRERDECCSTEHPSVGTVSALRRAVTANREHWEFGNAVSVTGWNRPSHLVRRRETGA